jgi:serine/threonine protein kinase
VLGISKRPFHLRIEAAEGQYRNDATWSWTMSGRLIATYRTIDYVGSGAFGSVFKAESLNTPGRIVAIKELHKKHTRNTSIKQRFFQEAVAMARLDHPNLPRLFTFGEDNGAYYLVMEFIEGRPLRDEIQQKGVLDPASAIRILSQVLEAVEYAHANGIIHRDLKPDNIMLADGDPPRVKVLDFGIARIVGGEQLTMTGEGFGTPAYMSPERITGLGEIDHRTDIYSLGIIMIEMLTGKPPFVSTATDPAAYWFEMRRLHESGELPSLAQSGAAAELEAVIKKAAAKDPANRFTSAREMLAALSSLSGGQASETGTSSLSLSIQPGAAEVFIDEVPRGVSDSMGGRFLIEGLTSGLHNVRVTRPGYNDYTIGVSLEGGRQTELQVALAARETMAIPQFEGPTAPIDFKTKKIDDLDNIQTALLVVESIPEGSTLFLGAQAVGRADASGRASIALQPGVHELQVAAPSGDLHKTVVTVTEGDTGSLKTITMPVPRAAATVASPPPALSQPSRTKRLLAGAAVLALLLVLGTLTFFALRAPSRDSIQEDAGTTASSDLVAEKAPPSSATENAAVVPADQPTSGQYVEKPAVKTAGDTDVKTPTKPVEPAPPSDAATPPATPQAPVPEPPDPNQQTAGDVGNGCLRVEVVRSDGIPIPGARVKVALANGGFQGATGERGRVQRCGFKAGQQGKIVVFGPGGRLLASRPVTITAGRNLVVVRVDKPADNADGLSDPLTGPRRQRRPFPRKP